MRAEREHTAPSRSDLHASHAVGIEGPEAELNLHSRSDVDCTVFSFKPPLDSCCRAEQLPQASDRCVHNKPIFKKWGSASTLATNDYHDPTCSFYKTDQVSSILSGGRG
jgi:hypothetical protein